VSDALYIGVNTLQLVHVNQIFVNARGDSQDFYFGHASLLLRKFVQPLKRALNTMYSKQLLDGFLCVKRHLSAIYQLGRGRAY
jgi:hypothetical protein